jgi:hypothetical protein
VLGAALGWLVLIHTPTVYAAGAGPPDPTIAKDNPQLPRPIYWREKLLFIPYQANLLETRRVAKVTLLVSANGGEWTPLEEARPEVRGFAYHAPQDGSYQFSIRLADRQGRTWPPTPVQPLLNVIVDTAPPQLQLHASRDAAGQALVRYEAGDAMLDLESIRLEAQAHDGTWQSVPLAEAELKRADRVIGRQSWTPAASETEVVFRLVARDQAGNQSIETTQLSLLGPRFAGPETPSIDRLPPIDLRQDNPSNPTEPSDQLPQSLSEATSRGQPNTPPPVLWPADGATAAGGNTVRADVEFPPDPQSARPAPRLRALPSALSTSEPPPLLSPGPLQGSRPGNLAVEAEGAPPEGSSAWQATSPPPDPASGVRLVNSRTFDVEYDLEAVGPWGVAKVELWGTRDGGQTWVSLGTDPDNRSPIRLTVPAPGDYGLIILVDAAGGIASPPPVAGTPPEMQVHVDLHPPAVELLAWELGSGTQADHLLIRWRAEDHNLERRPIGLYYSSYASGPWSTIATNLENSGMYAWQLQRHIPETFYLRIEARDTAGNSTSHQTSEPVVLQRPQPAGHLRGVRPIDRGQP